MKKLIAWLLGSTAVSVAVILCVMVVYNHRQAKSDQYEDPGIKLVNLKEMSTERLGERRFRTIGMIRGIEMYRQLRIQENFPNDPALTDENALMDSMIKDFKFTIQRVDDELNSRGN